MKRFLSLLLIVMILISPIAFPSHGYAQASQALNGIQAKGCFLLETNTGKVLCEKNANQKMYPASTTKILTALLAIEYGSLKEKVLVGEEISLLQRDGSKARLRKGESLSLADLLRGLMLPSGNDAALTIAVHIGRKLNGDESLPILEAMDKFADLMNDRARKAGALDSHFTNPHGYHDPNHYTTPHDMGMIAREAMKHDFFRKLVKTCKYIIESEGDHPDKKNIRKWENTNQLIQEESPYYYPYSTGIKTGYTSEAGYCLVSSASHGDLDVIAVVFGSSYEGRWQDSKRLLEHGLEDFQYHPVVEKEEVVASLPIIGQLQDEPAVLEMKASKGYTELLSKEEVEKIQINTVWDRNYVGPAVGEEGGFYLIPPVKKGERVGKAVFILEGKTLVECDLIAARDVKRAPYRKPRAIQKEEEASLFEWIRSGRLPYYVAALLILLILARLTHLRLKRRRRKIRRMRR
jgi:D-alanyl-D-alanine carboxypeptidase (penicillin-binding protein 5/6)